MAEKIASLNPLEKIKAVAASLVGKGKPDEKDVINGYLDEKKAVEQNRSIFERQWLTNIAFLYGKQHYAISKKNLTTVQDRIEWEFKDLDRKKKTTRTVNYILPLYRSLLSGMINMKSSVKTEPDTSDQRDVDAAKVGNEILEDFWENCNKTNPLLCAKLSGMQQVLIKAFSYSLSICQGTLHPYWNAKARGKVYLNEEVIESEVGQIEVDVLHNFEFVIDPCKQWAIKQRIKSVDAIKAQYGVEVEPEDIGVSEFERQLISLLGDGMSEQKYEKSARLYERFQVPNAEKSNGSFCVFVEKKMVYEGDLPEEYKGILPFFTIDYLDIPLAPFPQSMIEQLISLQEDYNFTIKRINDYKKWMTGKAWVPDGSKLQAKWDDEVGQVMKGSIKPEYINAPNIPKELFEDLNRIRRDMEDIAARHDVSMSRTPTGVKSGIAIENLQQADNSQVAPTLLHIEAQLSFFSQMVLNIAQAKYDEPRLIQTAGKSLLPEVRTFTGEAAKGNYRTKASIGSSLPASPDARRQYILMMLKIGLITPDKARELLEFGDTDGVYNDIDKTAERSEIQEMLKGAQIEPMPWENHAVRLKVLADFMMGDDFRKMMNGPDPNDPKAVDRTQAAHAIYEHYQAHQEMLLNEQRAAAVGVGDGGASQNQNGKPTAQDQGGGQGGPQ